MATTYANRRPQWAIRDDNGRLLSWRQAGEVYRGTDSAIFPTRQVARRQFKAHDVARRFPDAAIIKVRVLYEVID